MLATGFGEKTKQDAHSPQARLVPLALLWHKRLLAKNRAAVVLPKFCGPKKIGKSTIVRLCPYTNKIYADDNTIIKQKKEKIYLFPTPFWEKQNNQFKVQKLNPRPINKLYFLKHGSKNEIREIKDKKRKINLLWKTLKSPNYPPKLLKLTFLEIEFFPSTKIWKKLIKK